MKPCEIWIEQCKAARGIEDDFGTDKALAYLIGEKFLNFLEAAETDAEFRAEIPTFVAEIKTIFERWQLSEYLEIARRTKPFDPSIYDEDDDLEKIQLDRQEDIRRCTNDLLLVERGDQPLSLRVTPSAPQYELLQKKIWQLPTCTIWHRLAHMP